MGWADWKFTHLRPAPKRPEAVLGYEHGTPKGTLRLLVNDDTDVPSEEAARNFCRKFLGIPGDEREGCPTDHPVHVYFTENFDFAKSLFHGEQAQHFEFDGIIQDIIHDETGELTGQANIHRIRQGIVTPQPGVLIATNNSELAADNREHRSTTTLFAIAKDPDPEHRLPLETEEIQGFFRLMEENRNLCDDPLIHEYRSIIGRNTLAHIREFLGFLEGDTENRTPVVILGDSGTGKEAVARLIHIHDRYDTDRKFECFQPVLVASIPDGTLEGELFGVVSLSPRDYVEKEARPIEGYLAKSAHGTLFIDEIGDVSHQVQGMLLRFLQGHKVRPVGGDWTDVPDVRCVFATNRNLRDKKEVNMREDFLHRIDGLTLELPSLAERSGEHENLLDYFIGRTKAFEKTGMDAPFTDELRKRIIELCRAGAFTGNIRQLQRFVSRIVLVAERDRQIGMDALNKAMKYTLVQPDIQKN